jgi:hypothetical protein
MREIDRAERAQPARRHGVGIARGFAERGHHPASAQAFQRCFERRLADRIVDDGNAFAAGDVAHARGKVLARVDDRMIATMCAGNIRLRLGAHSPDHRRAQVLRPLAHDEADAARGGVDQDRIARLDLVRLIEEATCGHAADNHRGGRALVDVGRQGDDPRRGDDAQFGVGAFRHAGIGDAVADGKAAHLAPNCIDDAGAFEADRGRKRFHRMHTPAHQHVAVVDRDRDVADAHLCGTWSADLDVL